ncbi:LysM peptidoglycan-binding domain-containing protein [Longirhabdus pacifica]|uniref:LysM peptidoglycan-binding domain-containing protein n=1 Tax=Longirhabdus pacifica TaxID=2305227 RepID=UPI001008BEBD|nr:LysM peptidoglycan-binding domain-containing protein [Longirhabdus pacifica]
MYYSPIDFNVTQQKKKTMIKQRKIKMVKVCVMLVVSCLLFLLGSATIYSLNKPDISEDMITASTIVMEDQVTVIVKKGDTLWDIAVRNKPYAMDTRNYVYLLKEQNDLSNSVLQVGQVLMLPVHVEQ